MIKSSTCAVVGVFWVLGSESDYNAGERRERERERRKKKFGGGERSALICEREHVDVVVEE